MLSSIPTFLSYLLLIGSVHAQVDAPDCTNSDFDWTYNSLEQSPCLVAAYLEAACNNGSFSISSLFPFSDNAFYGPSGVEVDDLCECNTVVYSLVSACVAPSGTFPKPIPNDTRVPKWAYLNSFIFQLYDKWNATAAEAVGDNPLPSSSNRSEIEGGLIGGILGVILISGVVSWFVVRRQRTRHAPSTTDIPSEVVQPVQPAAYHPLTIETPRTYDPEDPKTYPRTGDLPLNNQHLGTTSHLQPNDVGYNGLPEV
ncbi:hypothetical protein V8E53_006418 [Lactarius tabidus]